MAAQSTAAQPSNLLANCHLLALPRELRDTIYEMVLKRDTPIEVNTTKGTRGQQPWLLRVNRQVRRETIPLFYKLNYFRLIVEVEQRTGTLFGKTTTREYVKTGTLGRLRPYIELLHGFEVIAKIVSPREHRQYNWRVTFAAGRPTSRIQHHPLGCAGPRVCEHCARHHAEVTRCEKVLDVFEDTDAPLTEGKVQNLINAMFERREELEKRFIHYKDVKL